MKAVDIAEGHTLTAGYSVGRADLDTVSPRSPNAFEAVPARSAALLLEAHRLRYQVYGVENPFEECAERREVYCRDKDAAVCRACPNGVEVDDFDRHSQHCLLLHKPTRTFVGATRLILPRKDAPEKSFPIQEICQDPLLQDPVRFPIPLMGEISRFCISKQRRQQIAAMAAAAPDSPANRRDRPAGTDSLRNMKLGLIEGLVQSSIANGVLYWCAEMEPFLLRLLGRIGIYFDPIGPLVNYHGVRQPCMVRLSTLLTRVGNEHPDVWAVLTADGRHWDDLLKMERDLLPRPMRQPKENRACA
ncbi:MAG: PEP-CTERM/exosortase system-associated acyltransferase [Rhodospirillales bacterium]|nr:MAG: PEP-CTERM/exosortase system-associated acyltransferase [Rhodospirillales bacterium]